MPMTFMTGRIVRSMVPTMDRMAGKMVMKRQARNEKPMRTTRSTYGGHVSSTAKSMSSTPRSTRFWPFCGGHTSKLSTPVTRCVLESVLIHFAVAMLRLLA